MRIGSRSLLAFVIVYGLFSFSDLAQAETADSARQAEVSARGTHVMPFDLKATTHIFIKTLHGGIQQVVAKKAGDNHQIRLIREHLTLIAKHFSAGNYAEPTSIHGANMPGLAELESAHSGDIVIMYHPLPNGGEIRFTTSRPELVNALHKWFDAQLSDHGSNAMEGHDHAAMMKMR